MCRPCDIQIRDVKPDGTVSAILYEGSHTVEHFSLEVVKRTKKGKVVLRARPPHGRGVWIFAIGPNTEHTQLRQKLPQVGRENLWALKKVRYNH
jgi:hypothetical protein